LTSALTYTTHSHIISDAESEEVRALLDPVNESSTTTSGDTPQASAPVTTAHTTLANNGQGARAEDDAAVAIKGEMEEGEQSRMAGGGAGQHTTEASKEMTQEGPVVALAEEETQIPSEYFNNTSTTNLANSGPGARAEDDAVVAMEGEITSLGEEGGQSRMADGGAGRHTTGASETSGLMSSGGHDTWTHTLRGELRDNPLRFRAPDKPRYKAGRG